MQSFYYFYSKFSDMYNVKDKETWGSKEKNNSVNNKTICLFLFSNAKQMAYVFA